VSAVLAEFLAGREPTIAIMPLLDAVGLVLDRDLKVPGPVPPQAIALRPGYAVVSADLAGVTPYSPRLLVSDPPWLEAGDAVPPGFDAVLDRGAVERRGATLEILQSCPPGEHVIRAGEDAVAGSCLRQEGQVLRSLDLAVASEAGLQDAAMRSVVIRCAIDAQYESLGFLFDGLDRARVQRVRVPARLDGAGADLLLVLTRNRATLDSLGRDAAYFATGVALSGAETVAAGFIDGVPILAAPPRAETLFALLCGLVRPYVAGLTRSRSEPVRLASLSRKLSSTIGLMEVAPVRETMGAVEPLGIGRLGLAAIAQADGYVLVPPESEGFQIGDTVEVFSAW